jgi:uncharacterized membrane protein
MARMETSIVIGRPLEEVFAFTTNFENQPKWQSRLLEATQISEGPIGVGTRWRLAAKFLGQRIEFDQECIEYEPNRLYAGVGKSGPFPIEGRQTYQRVDAGTQIDVTGEVRPGGFFKLAEPLVMNMLKRLTDADLANLKDLMEAHAL